MERFTRLLLAGSVAVGLLAGPASADTLPVDADTYARTNPRDADPLQPAGGAPFLHVRSGRGAEYNAYARFDLTALPALPPGVAIEKATLRAWVGDVSAEGAVLLAPVLEPWDEGSATAARHLALGAFEASLLVTTSDSRRYVSADLTALVQQWVSGALTNNGIALVGDPAGVGVQFGSKENAATGRPMELEVVVTSVGPEGPKGAPGPQGERGPQGTQGPRGAPAAARIYHLPSQVTLPAGSTYAAQLTCFEGSIAIGGSMTIFTSLTPNRWALVGLHESGLWTLDAWRFKVSNRSDVSVDLQLLVLCLWAS